MPVTHPQKVPAGRKSAGSSSIRFAQQHQFIRCNDGKPGVMDVGLRHTNAIELDQNEVCIMNPIFRDAASNKS